MAAASPVTPGPLGSDAGWSDAEAECSSGESEASASDSTGEESDGDGDAARASAPGEQAGWRRGGRRLAGELDELELGGDEEADGEGEGEEEEEDDDGGDDDDDDDDDLEELDAAPQTPLPPREPPPASSGAEWITNSRGRGRQRGQQARRSSGSWREEQQLRISVRRLSAGGIAMRV